MFRRLESGLPKDPIFPTDLKGLGYYINDKDEIRSIQNPKAYFKFFLTKNDRHNRMQRESMNAAIRDIVFDRLEKLGLEKIRVPLGAKETDPNLPIFVSSDLKGKKRVVILFYEHMQDLGIFAHRIIGGKGGINEGSAINLVKYIQSQKSSDDDDAPGIILANMGQLRWWRRGKQAVTQTTWYALPQKSSVDNPIRFDPRANSIPGNRSTEDHANYIFNYVVEELADPQAKLYVIGVSDGAVQVSAFLEKEDNFKKWGERVAAVASIATWFPASEIKNENFAAWFANRGRVYITSPEPAGTYVAGVKGAKYIPAYGAPIFSLGEPYYAESMLPKGYKTVIDWFQEVDLDADYVNPVFERFDVEEEEEVPSGWKEGGVPINQMNRIQETKEDEENNSIDGGVKVVEEINDTRTTHGVENEKPDKQNS